MTPSEQTTLPKTKNAFLDQLRALIDGVESGEYEMRDASLNFPIAETGAFDNDLPQIKQTGHTVVFLLLYKRPIHSTINSNSSRFEK